MKNTITINNVEYNGEEIYGTLNGDEYTVNELLQIYSNDDDVTVQNLNIKYVDVFEKFLNLIFKDRE